MSFDPLRFAAANATKKPLPWNWVNDGSEKRGVGDAKWPLWAGNGISQRSLISDYSVSSVRGGSMSPGRHGYGFKTTSSGTDGLVTTMVGPDMNPDYFTIIILAEMTSLTQSAECNLFRHNDNNVGLTLTLFPNTKTIRFLMSHVWTTSHDTVVSDLVVDDLFVYAMIHSNGAVKRRDKIFGKPGNTTVRRSDNSFGSQQWTGSPAMVIGGGAAAGKGPDSIIYSVDVFDRVLSIPEINEFTANWAGLKPRAAPFFVPVAAAGARPQGPLGHPLRGALGGPI